MFGLSTKRKTEPVQHGNLMERPLTGLAELRNEFDGLFERFWADVPRLSAAWEGFDRFRGLGWENEEDRYVLRAEAPGFDPSEFDVQIRGSQLVLSADEAGQCCGQVARSSRAGLRHGLSMLGHRSTQS